MVLLNFVRNHSFNVFIVIINYVGFLPEWLAQVHGSVDRSRHPIVIIVGHSKIYNFKLGIGGG